MGLSGLLIGLSPTYVVMIVFLVMLGATGGGYHPAAAPLVSATVAPEKRGRALGIHQIGGTASYFLTPLIAAAIATAIGWRGSFIAISIPAILFGITFYVLLGRRGYTRKTKPEIPSGHVESVPTPGGLRRLVALLILSIASLALIRSTISFIPLFMVDHFGVSKEAAAAMLALVYSGGLWAGPLGGYLSDRIGRIPVIVVTCLIAGPVVYLLNLAPFGWSMFAVLIAVGVVMHIPMPASEAYLVSQTSERTRSTVLGIYFFGSRGGLGVIMPVIGYLIDRFGFYTSFTIVGATLLVVALGCSIFLWGSRE
jgi:predicted MFS family arabinose efflux permease